MNIPRGYPATMVTSVLAVTILTAALFGNVNLFDVGQSLLGGIEKNEIDELIAAFLLIIAGLCADLFFAAKKRKREAETQAQLHRAEIQAQRLRVLKATMTTVQDIMNNFLQSLQLFRLDAEEVMPRESLTLLDDLIHGTSDKLRALGNLESTPEREMAVGIGIDYEQNAS
jgi:hypothetical protein